MSARRHIIAVLLSSLAIVAGLEGLLRAFDPLGVNAYYEWLAWSVNERVDHPTGYAYREGSITVAGHRVTIDAHGNRALPYREDATCTIALIGDSVTFGIGVGDTDTFAWRIAQAFPTIQFINTGKGGYDSTNLSDSLQFFEADVYIYTLVVNDTTSPSQYYPVQFDNQFALKNYRHWFQRQAQAYVHDANLYNDVLDIFAQHNVLYLSYEQHLAYELASERFDVALLPDADYVSIADPHPNADGHAQYADFIAPYLTQLDC